MPRKTKTPNLNKEYLANRKQIDLFDSPLYVLSSGSGKDVFFKKCKEKDIIEKLYLSDSTFTEIIDTEWSGGRTSKPLEMMMQELNDIYIKLSIFKTNTEKLIKDKFGIDNINDYTIRLYNKESYYDTKVLCVYIGRYESLEEFTERYNKELSEKKLKLKQQKEDKIKLKNNILNTLSEKEKEELIKKWVNKSD